MEDSQQGSKHPYKAVPVDKGKIVETIQDLENKFTEHTVSQWSRSEVRNRLKEDLQTACQIELATIPIYLFTYYSIKRNKNSGQQMSNGDLFANKAGGHIMSVAVEEMLHMSLAANIYFSLFGEAPELYRKSPEVFPTPLPHHKHNGPPGPDGKNEVLIPLAKFSFEQLWHFLQIETPGKGPLMPTDSNWTTIGQFYSYIRCLLNSPTLSDGDFQIGAAEFQIQSYNYSANNVDTVNPGSTFNNWKTPKQEYSAAKVAKYANANAYGDDEKPVPASKNRNGVQLMTISSKDDALCAIETICDQGEGADHTRWDDEAHELSHYYKFLQLQAQLEGYSSEHCGAFASWYIDTLPKRPPPPAVMTPTIKKVELDSVVVNFPDNPKTEDYPESLQPLSTFCNALYQYMLIMTETIFHVRADPALPSEAQAQKMYFNISLHRSMIWVLDKYIQAIRNVSLPREKKMAPTFEFVDLGTPKDAFGQLTRYGKAAIEAESAMPEGDRPGIKEYVETAIGGKGPLHLPNVADYIK